MKYFSIETVVNAYKGFQDSMTNKSWGYLALLKGCNDSIRPLIPYEVNMDIVSNFLEGIFNLSSTKRQYDGGRSLYVVFSNKWENYFNDQGRYSPKIYDVAVWAYRRKAFPDDITREEVINDFSKEFNIPFSIIKESFNTQQKNITFTETLYSEATLKLELARIGVDVSRNNIDAKKGGVVASPGEISRGPFVQTLYAGLDITDYVLILQSNYYSLYGDCKKESENNGDGKSIQSIQQIFYGAPGTGKSHKVKELTGKESVVRTTFHPDSDYSTFVGAYKPTSIEVPMRDVTGKVIVEDGQKVTENRIVYEFVEQAFLKAYIKAWKMYAEDENNPKNQYLVIEEINRGNCAQIFGDLFQLLDRGANGFSEYPIDADKDMQKHLAKAFKDMAYLEAPAIGEMSAEETARTIRNGEKLILPSNLYIWATMNTSDQSLFPIDSAFKRRWDWQYVPIHNCNKGWRIAANGKQYDWWDFIEKINNVISKLTSSEDKKLGYFFCKADNDGTVSADKLVAKVLFYLWNDVFKDYEVDSNILRDGESSLNFNSFYGVNGNETFIRQDKVDLFLSNLGVNLIRNNSVDDEPEEDEDGNEFSSSSKNYDKFSVNGIGRYGKNRLAFECLKKYVELNSNMSADEVLRIWKNLEMNVPHFVESKDEYESRTDNSKRSYAVSCGGTIIYVAHNGYGSNGKVDELISIVNRQGWGINLARVL